MLYFDNTQTVLRFKDTFEPDFYFHKANNQFVSTNKMEVVTEQIDSVISQLLLRLTVTGNGSLVQ